MQLRNLLIGIDTDEKVVGEGKSVSWGVARFKGKGRECEITKKMFFHNDLLKLCLKKKNGRSVSSSLTPLFYYYLKKCVAN